MRRSARDRSRYRTLRGPHSSSPQRDAAHAEELAQSGGGIVYRGDPLQDLSLSAFLDRFSYRNPKKSIAERIKSTSVPRAGEGGGASRMRPRTVGRSAVAQPVNQSGLEKRDSGQVRVEEAFYHRYFSLARVGDDAKDRAEADDDKVEEGDDGDSDAEDRCALSRAE